MNARHSKVTDWGLGHISIQPRYTILDVGCGGGRTVSTLAAMAGQGKVYGLDYSPESVAVARRINRQWIDAGRVEICEASVSQIPFPDRMFDLITAVETHFWWPDLPASMREVFRVLKPGGMLAVIAEIHKGADTAIARLAEKYVPAGGMKFLTADEHGELFAQAGFTNIQISTEKSWICATGQRP